MRRQTLSLLPALLVALALPAFLGFQLRRARQSEQAPAPGRQLEVLGLALEVPAAASTPVTLPGDPWTAVEFHSAGLGRFRLARERAQGDLQGALRQWFQLPGPLDRPLSYTVAGQPAQARPVTVFGPGGYFLQHQGRGLVAVCVFDLGESRYWVQTRVPGAGRESLAGFDRLLLSMRQPGGEGVDARLQPDLASAQASLGVFRAAGAPEWIIFFPAGLMGLAAGLVFWIGKRSGRPPRDPVAGATYTASGVEVCLAAWARQRYFDAAIVVLEDRLLLYTFGTPFLSLPKKQLRGQLADKTGWFGSPYLEITLEGKLDYLKNRFLMGTWTGKTRLRIYSEDGLRLRMALGG